VANLSPPMTCNAPEVRVHGLGQQPAPAGCLGGCDIFTGGGSHDTLSLTLWQWTHAKPQSKDDLEDAYAAEYTGNGSQFVHLGADRYDNSGDTTLGFWLLQNDVGTGSAPVGGAPFLGAHRDGDLLVILDGSVAGGSSPRPSTAGPATTQRAY
jgi:hypothetical protein